jgi:hypothetical protein
MLKCGSDLYRRSWIDAVSNDLADLALNGDTTATGADALFLSIGDGFIKQAKTSTEAHVVDITGTTNYKEDVFPAMLSSMPNKFKRDKANLRIYCSTNVADSYIKSGRKRPH